MAVANRDARIVLKQQKIAACGGSVAKALHVMMKNGKDLLDIPAIQSLTDYLKFLGDLQNNESCIRRNLIMANIKTPFRNTLAQTTCGEYLFGDKLEENIKAAKALSSTSNDRRGRPRAYESTKNFSNLPRFRTKD